MLTVKEGTGLHICVFDDVTDCRVFITEYTGDGTSLTIDDLVPVPEDEKATEEVEENNDETEEKAEGENL